MNSILFSSTSTGSNFQKENIHFEDNTSTNQGPRDIMFKEHPVFIPVSIVSAPISIPVVD